MNNRWRWMISGVAVLLLTVFLPVRAAAAGELSRATTRGEEETRIRALVQT